MPPKKKKAADTAEPKAKARRKETPAQAAAAAPVVAVPTARAKAKVDVLFPCAVAGQHCYQEDNINWDVMLNQTNIGQNNNKYYVIQLIPEANGQFVTFTRWGRVGEPGQNQMQRGNLDGCKKVFADKFKDKTKNDWGKVSKEPSSFVAHPGKYTLVETAVGDEAEAVVAPVKATPTGPALSSKLHPKLQEVLALIFDKDMFKKSMTALNLDANKMPLGKLTKAQVEKGYSALEELENAIKAGQKRPKLAELTSKFYTIIPHNFGRMVPPVIDAEQTVKEKFDLLNVLNDIQIAVSMDAAAQGGHAEHPLDKQYKELGCGISYVEPTSAEFDMIKRYTDITQGWAKCRVKYAFRVDRPDDKKRMEKFKTLGNRKLLWHGTNIAVVAAILKSGLRIMPHAGGRVGKGLYFASENGKSASYVRTDNKRGFMFLNEVVLGNAKEINQDDHTLQQSKVEGLMKVDSIIARGRQEPDPSKDISIPGEWGPISVPQGAPVKQPQWHNSTFSQSEYLVYDEAKVRIKYLLWMDFDR